MKSEYRLANEGRAFDFIENVKRLSSFPLSERCIDLCGHRGWIRSFFRVFTLEQLKELAKDSGVDDYDCELYFDSESDCYEQLSYHYQNLKEDCIGGLLPKDYLATYYDALNKYLKLDYWTVNDCLYLMLGLIPGSFYIFDLKRTPGWGVGIDYSPALLPHEILEVCTSGEGVFINTHEARSLADRYAGHNTNLLPVNDVVNFLLINGFFVKNNDSTSYIQHSWRKSLLNQLVLNGFIVYERGGKQTPTWNGTTAEAEFLAKELKRRSYFGSRCHQEFHKIVKVKGAIGKGNPVTCEQETLLTKMVSNLPTKEN